LKTEKKAELEDFQNISQVLRILPGQQLAQVLKKHLPADVPSEYLLLKRPTRPRREHWLRRIQDGFIQECDDGIQRERDIVRCVSQRSGLLFRPAEQLLDLRSEGLGISGDLPVCPQAHSRRQNFLEGKGELTPPRGTGVFRG
jgi:hypothetical protein